MSYGKHSSTCRSNNESSSGFNFYNPVGHASNNQTGSVFGNSVEHYMNNYMTMITNLNPSMGYHFPDQQSHANLQNNVWYNNQP